MAIITGTDPGYVETAYRFYDSIIDENKDRTGPLASLASGSAKFTKGLLSLSGLHDAEQAAGQWGYDNGVGAPTSTQVWSGVKTLGHSALVVASFLPAASGMASMMRGEKLIKTASTGGKIAGLGKAAQGVSKQVTGELGSLVARSFPKGTKVTAETIQAFKGQLAAYAKKNGVKLLEGGKLGESVGSLRKVVVNTKVGGAHEMTHALQQVQSRVTLLRSQANKLGKSVKQLSKMERRQVAKQVKNFEAKAYQHHEMWAKQATTFGGKAKNSYAKALKGNLRDFGKALSRGKVPQGPKNLVSRAYGNLPNLLGKSQAQIAKNLTGVVAAFTNHQIDTVR